MRSDHLDDVPVRRRPKWEIDRDRSGSLHREAMRLRKEAERLDDEAEECWQRYLRDRPQ